MQMMKLNSSEGERLLQALRQKVAGNRRNLQRGMDKVIEKKLPGIVSSSDTSEEAYDQLNELMRTYGREVVENTIDLQDKKQRSQKEDYSRMYTKKKKAEKSEKNKKLREEKKKQQSGLLKRRHKKEEGEDDTHGHKEHEQKKRRTKGEYKKNLDVMYPFLSKASGLSVNKVMQDGGYLDEELEKTQHGLDLEDHFMQDKLQRISTSQQYYLNLNFTNNRSGDYTFEQDKTGKNKQVSMTVKDNVPLLRGNQIVPLGTYDHEHERSKRLEKEDYSSSEQARLIMTGDSDMVEEETDRNKNVKVDPYREFRAMRILKQHEESRFPEIALSSQLTFIGAKNNFFNLANDYYHPTAPHNPMSEEKATTHTNPYNIDPKNEVVKSVHQKGKNTYDSFIGHYLDMQPELDEREGQFVNSMLDLLENDELLKKVQQKKKDDWEIDEELFPHFSDFIDYGANVLRSPEREDLDTQEEFMLIEEKKKEKKNKENDNE